MLKLIIFTLLAAIATASRLEVIGGKDVDPPGKYPWQVALTYLDRQYCGGSLLSAHWVLTAAHCIVGSAITDEAVLIGAHDIETRSQGNPMSYPFSAVFINPDWIDVFRGGDIGLVFVQQHMDIEGNEFADRISMAEEGADFMDADCVISGWGRTEEWPVSVSTNPDILQEADVREVDHATCEERHGRDIGETVICVSGDFERGGCHGDSGGPLVCQQDGELVLVGVTAGGDTRCRLEFPSLYGRVSHHRAWIKEVSGL